MCKIQEFRSRVRGSRRVPLDSNEPLGWTMIGVATRERMSHPRTNASVREERARPCDDRAPGRVRRARACRDERSRHSSSSRRITASQTARTGCSVSSRCTSTREACHSSSPVRGVRIRTDALRRAPLFAFDLAPTVHALVGLAVPRGMTGSASRRSCCRRRTRATWRPRRYARGYVSPPASYDTDTGLKLHVSFGRQGRMSPPCSSSRSATGPRGRSTGSAHACGDTHRPRPRLPKHGRARTRASTGGWRSRDPPRALRGVVPALKVMLLRLCQLESESRGELAAWDLAVMVRADEPRAERPRGARGATSRAPIQLPGMADRSASPRAVRCR